MKEWILEVDTDVDYKTFRYILEKEGVTSIKIEGFNEDDIPLSKTKKCS